MTGQPLEILAPRDGAQLSSPLAVLRVRYAQPHAPTATLWVGQVKQVVELAGESGELRENITLLEGENRLRVEAGGASAEVTVSLAPGGGITIGAPGAKARVETRAVGLTGSYQSTSCPAGVIAVNGFMQQFSVRGAEGTFDEKVVLRPGANHLAVQIGERYTTRLVEGTFHPAKLLVTLVWDTPDTDVDLYVTEPSGACVYFRDKFHDGTLDVDRQHGFGPENYSLGFAERPVKPGVYKVRVHYYADRGVGRTEWTVRVISDESSLAQQRRTCYGILDFSRSEGDPNGSGRDWNDVCEITVSADGAVAFR